MVIIIWAGYTYYNIDDVCYEYWLTYAKILLIYVYIESIMLWIIVGIFGVIIIGNLIMCFHKKKPSNIIV